MVSLHTMSIRDNFVERLTKSFHVEKLLLSSWAIARCGTFANFEADVLEQFALVCGITYFSALVYSIVPLIPCCAKTRTFFLEFWFAYHSRTRTGMFADSSRTFDDNFAKKGKLFPGLYWMVRKLLMPIS